MKAGEKKVIRAKMGCVITMVQNEVFEWLRLRRLGGDDEFYGVGEVWRRMRREGIKFGYQATSNSLWTLARFGFFERENPTDIRDWRVGFRYKLRPEDVQQKRAFI